MQAEKNLVANTPETLTPFIKEVGWQAEASLACSACQPTSFMKVLHLGFSSASTESQCHHHGLHLTRWTLNPKGMCSFSLIESHLVCYCHSSFRTCYHLYSADCWIYTESIQDHKLFWSVGELLLQKVLRFPPWLMKGSKSHRGPQSNSGGSSGSSEASYKQVPRKDSWNSLMQRTASPGRPKFEFLRLLGICLYVPIPHPRPTSAIFPV